MEEKFETQLETIENYIRQNDFSNAISSYYQLAFLYFENGLDGKAIETLVKTIPIHEKLNNWKNIEIINHNLGLLYTSSGGYENAKSAFNKCLEINKQLKDKHGEFSSFIDVEYITGIMGNFSAANYSLKKILDSCLHFNYQDLTLRCYDLLYHNFYYMGKTNKAQFYKYKYESYYRQIINQRLKKSLYNFEGQNPFLPENVNKSKRDQQEKRLAQMVYAQFWQDSITKIKNMQTDSLFEAERISNQRKNVIEGLKAKELVQHAELEKERAKKRAALSILTLGAIVLALAIATSIFVFRGYRTQQRSNIQLTAKNKEIEIKNNQLNTALKQIESQNINITKSINYAKGIQEALLPKLELLNTYIPESFILYKPRDIVSGDFYWFSEIDKRRDLYETHNEYLLEKLDNSFDDFHFLPIENTKFAIAAVDCTGHGVPGAFMSLIGYNILDDIIASGISRPEVILKELHKNVRSTLKQDISENRDGMDISLCIINKKTRMVYFAGAENPLLYIQDGKITRIRGERNSIGGLQIERKRVFTEHAIKVDRPTWFYIFSDGFVDQFGGEKGRKYLLGNLEKLLLTIYRKPMNEQKEILYNEFKNWMGNEYKQIDDMLVIGFKLG